MIQVNYQNLIDFIRFNRLNRDKAIVKQWVELLSQSDDNFSVEKFLNEIEYWEQD